MSPTLLEMSKELVTELIRQHRVSQEEVQTLLQSTHITLQALYQAELSGTLPISTSPEEDTQKIWKRAITKYAVTCLECGQSFRQLSVRHLRRHDLDARTYRAKYHIPKTQPLSSLAATARRRQLAKQIRPWEKAHEQQSAAKGKAKASGKK